MTHWTQQSELMIESDLRHLGVVQVVSVGALVGRKRLPRVAHNLIEI